MDILAAATAANPTLAALWSRARADYLEGATATEACKRYGLSKSRFFARAKAEGWRRKDETAEGLPPEEAFDPEAPVPPTRDMAETAWRRACHALETGNLREAKGWLKLSLELRECACDEAGVSSWRRLIGAPTPATPAPAREIPHPIPAYAMESADALIRYAAEVMDWPELALEAAPEPAVSSSPKPRAQEPAKAGPTPPQDSQDSFSQESGPPPFVEDAALDIVAPPSTPHPESWAAWAGVCDQLRRERPDEPWWGED